MRSSDERRATELGGERAIEKQEYISYPGEVLAGGPINVIGGR